MAALIDAPAPIHIEIIGASEDADYRSIVEDKMKLAVSAGNRIEWQQTRPDHEAFEALLDDTSILALPYLHGWNSGLAIQALEHGVKLLCSDLPLFRELQGKAGESWVHCAAVQRPVTPETLAWVASSPTTEDVQRLTQWLSSMSWSAFADQLDDFLESK